MSDELLIAFCLRYLNIPYLWGGKSPLLGLDCSGLACEILKAQGYFKEDEYYDAQQLYDLFYPKSLHEDYRAGSLLFYGRDLRSLDHVGILLSGKTMISSAHGDHTTTSLEMAQKQNACVKLRPYLYRKDFLACLKPN